VLYFYNTLAKFYELCYTYKYASSALHKIPKRCVHTTRLLFCANYAIIYTY